MTDVVELEAYKPHISIIDTKGGVRIFPRSYFEDVVKGKYDIRQMDDFEVIMPRIIEEWLNGL